MSLPAEAWHHVQTKADAFRSLNADSPETVIKGLPSNPEHRATAIYCMLREFDYGIDEAVRSGTRFRYPHQIQKQLTCGEAAVYVYMLAQYAGLNPRLFRLSNIDGMQTDHFFVDASIDGERYAIDPLMRLSGRVRYRLGRLITGKKSVTATGVETMSEDDVVKFADRLNSPQGVFDYLAVRQRLGERLGDFGVMNQYASFSPNDGFIVDDVTYGIPSWVTIVTTAKPYVRITLARGFEWGQIIRPFYTHQFGDGKGTTSFNTTNFYPGLKKEVAKVLAYWITLTSLKSQRDGSLGGMRDVFVRTPEEDEAFRNFVASNSEEWKIVTQNRRFLEHLEGLREKNPEFARRWLDYKLFEVREFPRVNGSAIRKHVWEGKRPTTQQMLAKLEDTLGPQRFQDSVDFYLANSTLLTLRKWVDEAQGIPQEQRWNVQPVEGSYNPF